MLSMNNHWHMPLCRCLLELLAEYNEAEVTREYH